jgi:hypothetical protein
MVDVLDGEIELVFVPLWIAAILRPQAKVYPER